MRVLLLVRGRTRCTKPHLELRFVTSLEAQDGRPSRSRECGGLTEMTDTGTLEHCLECGGLEVYR